MPTLAAHLNSADEGNWSAYNGGRNSATLLITPGNAGFAYDYMAGVDSLLGAIPKVQQARVVVLINFGANDYCCGMPDQAAWEAKALDLMDRVYARWPQAEILWEYPWTRGQDAIADAFAGYIDDVRAARGLTMPIPDERVWMKGADNGITMSIDGTHYSSNGDAEQEAQRFAQIFH